MEYTKCRRERQKNARGSGACDTRAQDTARKTGKRAGGDCARRRRHGGRHDSEPNTVTGSCPYEPDSTKALRSLVSYIAPPRMTPRVPCLAMPGCSTASAKKERAPRGFSSRGVSRKRHVLTCRGGESERLDGVPAGHRRERLRVKTKRPPAVLAGGLVNPAATYSPGPEGQVPSAI